MARSASSGTSLWCSCLPILSILAIAPACGDQAEGGPGDPSTGGSDSSSSATSTGDPGVETTGESSGTDGGSDDSDDSDDGSDGLDDGTDTSTGPMIDGPDAEDDEYFTVQNQALVISAEDGLLANDSDPDGPVMLVDGDTMTSGGGSVAIADDGSFSYSPGPGHWGPDIFEYTVANEAGGLTTATATVFVEPRTIQIADVVDGHWGFAIDGETFDDNVGFSVSGGGDVNGDGLHDVLVAGGEAGREVCVVFGKTDTMAVNISALGGSGFRINVGDLSRAVGNAGDVNGDGLADVVLGEHTGVAAHVIFGKADTNTVNIEALGTDGFSIHGPGESLNASSVDGLGDVNGDGLSDVIVGDRYGAQGAYVIHGKADGDPVYLDGPDGWGFPILSAFEDDDTGRAVSGVGDVDGDGLFDILVGSPQNYSGGTAAGAAFLLFGKADTTPIDLGAPELPGYSYHSTEHHYLAGRSVSGAGDVNGDGWPDFVLGAPANNYPDWNSLHGYTRVIFGGPTLATFNPASEGVGGFKILNASVEDSIGAAVSGAGDFNGDGLADLILGGPHDGLGFLPDRVYVVFGSTETTTVDLSALGDRGVVIEDGPLNSFMGYSVRGAGDVNGDGVDDIIMGDPSTVADQMAFPPDQGQAVVIFGVRTSATGR